MNKNAIVNNVTKNLYKIGFKFKKHSPEILLVAGIVGTVASAVMACKATTKVSEIVDESKKTIDVIHETVENPEMAEKYSEEDSKKDLAIVYTQTAVKMIKLYAPSVVLGVASIACILGSHNIIRQRNVALAAAYATVDKGFKEYRGRVVERFGKDLDRELKYNIKAKEIEKTVVDENGNETVERETIQVAEPDLHSNYAKFFDEYCKGWEKDPEQNLYFLKQVQNWANQKLKTQGYLFLNEVYEALGIPKTSAGQVVGWVYDEEHPIGDNYVDFGIYDLHRPEARDFVNGYERSILLDFNVDGNILEYI